MKIAIIGYSGSGKSTLAKKISEIYNLPLLYLDTLNFLENWVEKDRNEMISEVNSFLNKNNNWVIDGNYFNICFLERMAEADKIIFLNFNRFVCLYRAIKRRNKYKGKVRESIAKGCEEKIDFEFAKWILYDGRIKERKAVYLNTKAKYQDKFIEIKNQKQLDSFINHICL